MSKVRIYAGVPTDGVLRVVVLSESGFHLRSIQVDDLGQVEPSRLMVLATPHMSPEVTAEFLKSGVQILHGQLEGISEGAKLRLFALDPQRQVLAWIDVDRPEASLPDGGLVFSVASCFYKDFHQAANYRAALLSRFLGPSTFKLLIGDNLYLDTAHSERGLDTGPIETVYRYLDYLWKDAYGDTVACLPSLVTFDDHELWNNYPEDVKWLDRSKGQLRAGYQKAGLECLDLFQTALNPPRLFPGLRERSFKATISSVPFFFLDMRTNREFRTSTQSQMFSDAGLEELDLWAKALPGPGVLVLGQPLFQGFGSGFDWHPADFGGQFAALWEIIGQAKHDVLLISGDVHHSRVLELEVGARRVFEIVTSPASHIPTVSSIASGSFNAQAVGAVEFPSRAPLQSPRPEQKAPVLLRYWVGSTAPNTIAQIRLSRHAAGGLAVGVAFVDIDGATGPRIADAAAAAIDGDGTAPAFATCLVSSLTHLR